MSTTLTYGRKVPTNGDTSATWMPDLEANATLDDGHTHNGVDSAILSSASFEVITVTAAAASWSLVANGTYKQTVTMPGVLEFSNKNVSFRNASTGDVLYLTCKKVSATTFDIYINDNTITVSCLIGA